MLRSAPLKTGVIVYDALFLGLAEDGDTVVVTADGKPLKALEGAPYTRLAHPLAAAGSRGILWVYFFRASDRGRCGRYSVSFP